MKIVITGGACFIGSELSEYIIKKFKKNKIIIIDNLTRGSFKRISHIKKKN